MPVALSLNSPHDLVHLQEGVAFTVDQTRGILTYVASNCPGRFHDEVEYVTVAGKFVEGAGLRQKGASIAQRLVGVGYLQVCGEAAVWGDGVVPLPAAHLEGGALLYLWACVSLNHLCRWSHDQFSCKSGLQLVLFVDVDSSTAECNWLLAAYACAVM